jgi:hypothetical protein
MDPQNLTEGRKEKEGKSWAKDRGCARGMGPVTIKRREHVSSLWF